MQHATLKDLYIHELKDLASAEKQFAKALPKMVDAASHPELKTAFENHLGETLEQLGRLDKILATHGHSSRGQKCKGVKGLIKEGKEMISEEEDEDVLDAGLISLAQHIEHYEIAGYGCARSFAEVLGDTAGARLLDQSIREVGSADRKLTELAISVVNLDAKG